MNFNNLYNRVVFNEAKEKQKREEDVEQFDHAASVASQEQEEEYDREDTSFKHRTHTWEGTDIDVKFAGRVGEYVVEGTVDYTIEEERPDASNGYIGSKWPEVEDYEVTGIFLVGDAGRDAQEITHDVTFEEMEIAEKALIGAFEQQETD
jgi:hypothetical protein